MEGLMAQPVGSGLGRTGGECEAAARVGKACEAGAGAQSTTAACAPSKML